MDQIRPETQLLTANLGSSNNPALAQTQAAKASSLLDNDTRGQIRERNNRTADTLEAGSKQLEGNVTSLLASASQGQTIPQDRIQKMNQSVASLNDILAGALYPYSLKMTAK
ncbi:MAG: hypothetical protein M3247_08025 [Thermoproteota archaeon]|nr:hypothetical protein [Thermoproteota archaeon]